MIAVALGILTTTADSAAPTQVPVFDQVWQTVKDNFFDPKMNGVDWEAAGERYRKEAEAVGSPDAFAAVVNRMLSELKTSHTRYYTAQEPENFQLAGIFCTFASENLKTYLRG